MFDHCLLQVRLSDLECFSRPREGCLVNGDLIKPDASGILATGTRVSISAVNRRQDDTMIACVISLSANWHHS